MRAAAKKHETHLACHISVTEEGIFEEANRILDEKNLEDSSKITGVPPGTRTPYLRIKSPLLYRMS